MQSDLKDREASCMSDNITDVKLNEYRYVVR